MRNVLLPKVRVSAPEYLLLVRVVVLMGLNDLLLVNLQIGEQRIGR